MIYEITRSSSPDDPKVAGAVKVEGFKEINSYFRSFTELDAARHRPFIHLYRNQMYMKNGHLHFSKPATYWTLEIDDPLSLLNEEVVEIIISRSNLAGILYTIEIYDDYRE